MNIRRRLLAVVLVASLCTFGLAISATRGEDASQRHHGTHGHRLYWGAWTGEQLTGASPPWDMAAQWAFEQESGRRASIIHFAAGKGLHDMPVHELQAIRRHGSIPLVSYAPGCDMEAVASGRLDATLRRWASETAAWGHPLMVRLYHEMNGTWFCWSPGVGHNSARTFVAAWRHVVSVYRHAGAEVTWVWCPNVGRVRSRGYSVASMYPGSRYVDWTCLDGYNYNARAWRSFDRLFHRSYERLVRTIAPGKPVMIGETGTVEDPRAPHRKARWISNMLRLARSRRYARLAAVVYWDCTSPHHTNLETSRRSVSAWRAGIRARAYQGPRYSSISAPIGPP